jgi:hypothetical protein
MRQRRSRRGKKVRRQPAADIGRGAEPIYFYNIRKWEERRHAVVQRIIVQSKDIAFLL